jgi:hypothetical protein
MTERERQRQGGNPADAGEPTGAGNLVSYQQQAQAFLAAGDKAIDSVLSGDSAKFNQQARQQGGQ